MLLMITAYVQACLQYLRQVDARLVPWEAGWVGEKVNGSGAFVVSLLYVPRL